MRADLKTFGVDLGGTSIRIGLFNEAMQMIGIRRLATQVSAGAKASVHEIAAQIASLIREHGIEMESVLGLGIGSPGPIDLRRGVLGLLPNLPGWEQFPLRDELQAATGFPVQLESDANAAAIAEWKLGAGRDAGLDSLAMITLGTGVGSGLILAGRVWHGMFGMGGEVGHAAILPGGLLCGCGSYGCLEMYASAGALVRMAGEVADSAETTAELRSVLTREATPHAIAKLAERGDRGARLAFARYGSYLGIGIANLINTLDLPMIVIGGGVASAWPFFSPAMFEAVRKHSVVYRLVAPTQFHELEQDRTYIRPAELGPSAGLLGAALLPRLTTQARGSEELRVD